MEPTYTNINNGKTERDVRSTCCKARVSIKLRSTDTTAGDQIVYYCWKCCKMYVVRASDVEAK
jgi:hypothetical protein